MSISTADGHHVGGLRPPAHPRRNSTAMTSPRYPAYARHTRRYSSPASAVSTWTSSASFRMTLPTSGTAASPSRRWRRRDAVGRRASPTRPLAGSELHVDGLGRVAGGARGDHVGDQDGVVEAVERQVGAGGEHAHHPAQHGPTSGPDATEIVVSASGIGSPPPPSMEGIGSSGMLAPLRHTTGGEHMLARLPRSGSCSISSCEASAAISGSPRPGALGARVGLDAPPVVGHDDRQAVGAVLATSTSSAPSRPA